jgi:MoaA/NifB/PqqE/SkfB family radical SAM enzyme
MMRRDTELHARHEELTIKLYADDAAMPARFCFVLTLACNMRCPFCPQDRFARGPKMTTADWLAVADQLPDYARVTLTGGEPLLYQGFKEVMEHVAHDHDVNVITNGSLLTEAIVDFLLSFPRFKVLSVSIDTPGNLNRGYSETQWEAITTGLAAFVRRRNQLGHPALLDIKTVVCEDSAPFLSQVYLLGRDTLKADTHAFQFLKGSPLQHAGTMSPFEAAFLPSSAPMLTERGFALAQAELETVRNLCREGCPPVFFHPSLIEFMERSRLPDLSLLYNRRDHDPGLYGPCRFPWSSLHINADGEAFPCLAISMGNVRELSLNDIVRGEEMRRFRAAIREMGTLPGCNRCGWIRPAAPPANG